jgi:hypothetical protein
MQSDCIVGRVVTFSLRKPSDESPTTSVGQHWHILATMYDEVPDYCRQRAVNGLLWHFYNQGLIFITASRIDFQATSPSQCTRLTTRLSSVITTITGQETIGSKRQSDLLKMGENTPETC